LGRRGEGDQEGGEERGRGGVVVGREKGRQEGGLGESWVAVGGTRGAVEKGEERGEGGRGRE